MTPDTPARNPVCGFSLIELLVVLAVIGILVTLAVASLSSTLINADKAAATASMRQIGVGMKLHAAEHNNLLPGPLWPGQIPVLDPNRDGRLVRVLAPYLGIQSTDQPELIDLFVPRAYSKKYTGDLKTARTYVMNMSIQRPDGRILEPFGNLATGNTTTFSLAATPSSQWAFSDADQEHPRVMNAPWAGNTPEEPIHGDMRLALRFDGSISTIPQSDLE